MTQINYSTNVTGQKLYGDVKGLTIVLSIFFTSVLLTFILLKNEEINKNDDGGSASVDVLCGIARKCPNPFNRKGCSPEGWFNLQLFT